MVFRGCFTDEDKTGMRGFVPICSSRAVAAAEHRRIVSKGDKEAVGTEYFPFAPTEV